MSLLSSIQMAATRLQATDIGLQVVGQNISNANTPGYIQEQVNLQPAPTQQYGGLLLGTGVQVQSITEQIDNFLEERLRGAGSDQANADTVEQTYTQLERRRLGSDASSTSDTTNGCTRARMNTVLLQHLRHPQPAGGRVRPQPGRAPRRRPWPRNINQLTSRGQPDSAPT